MNEVRPPTGSGSSGRPPRDRASHPPRDRSSHPPRDRSGHPPRGRRRYDGTKRAIDLTVAATVLLLALPVLLVVAAVVAVALGRPVLFRQRRPGRNGTLFELVKFRTMRDADPASGLVDDADRLTRTGRWLRATSLDELPTLWNVLRGEMSLVGPRPLLPDYLHRYTPEQARRHEVRPGVTGLAQVRGRNALTWEAKFGHDVWYVDNRDLRLDLRILVETAVTVLRRDGVTAHGSVTAHPFTGGPVGHPVAIGATGGAAAVVGAGAGGSTG